MLLLFTLQMLAFYALHCWATTSHCWATRLLYLVAQWATTFQSNLASPAVWPYSTNKTSQIQKELRTLSPAHNMQPLREQIICMDQPPTVYTHTAKHHTIRIISYRVFITMVWMAMPQQTENESWKMQIQHEQMGVLWWWHHMRLYRGTTDNGTLAKLPTPATSVYNWWPADIQWHCAEMCEAVDDKSVM